MFDDFDDDYPEQASPSACPRCGVKQDLTNAGMTPNALAAVKLFKLGRLSSGRAAELAGMTRVEFILSLGRHRVFPLNAELNDLEQDGRARSSHDPRADSRDAKDAK